MALAVFLNHKKSKFKNSLVSILLWIVVLFNMIFADICSIIVELVNGGIIDIPFDVLTTMAVAAVLTNIPILMIVLSWVLPYKINKWTNIGGASFTILYIIGGSSLLPHYFIIGGIEIVLLLLIIVTVSKWTAQTFKPTFEYH